MTFSLFTARKTEINVEISAINAEITLLQQNLQKQQQFLQEIGTVEQAGESALAQAQTFLAMVRMIDPSQESVFWSAMDALKVQNQAVFPVPENEADEAEELATEAEVEAEVVEDDDDDDDEIITNIAEVEIETVIDEGKLLTPAELKALSWGVLKAIAERKGIVDPTGQRLTRRLVEKSLLTRRDVLDATGNTIGWYLVNN